MASKGNCPVCGTDGCSLDEGGELLAGAVNVDCPQCLAFNIIGTVVDQYIGNQPLRRAMLSNWIRNYERGGTRLVVRPDAIKSIATLPIPTIKERIEGYLIAASNEAYDLDISFERSSRSLISAAYCLTANQLVPIIDWLVQKGFLERRGADRARFTAEGYMYCDELRTKLAASSQGFIAMWFDPSMEDARKEGLEVGVRTAGYKPHRVDDNEHIDQIDDRIIADIRRSKFLVADLTGQRQGVYYEAGFARGLQRPVFYTCRDDEKDKIHFDIRQFNCIFWSDPKHLAMRLRNRIEAVIGAGPDATT